MKFNFVLDIIKTLFKGLFMLSIPLLILFLIIILLIFIFYCYHRYVKKIKPIKSDLKKIKQDGVLKRIFYKFPYQFTLDFLRQDPNDFGEFGIHMICGEQGAGKTITAVYLMNMWQNRYRKLQVYTNFEYSQQDGEIEHWKELLLRNNGKYGVVNCLDEIHTWFSNRESANIPPSFLGEISQQRKQKKAIIGTAQVFGKIAKPLREQSHFVYRPFTFFNCITFVFKTKAQWYDSEKDKFKRYSGFFFFVHDNKLRESYDTFKKIERYKDIEFTENTNYLSNNIID